MGLEIKLVPPAALMAPGVRDLHPDDLREELMTVLKGPDPAGILVLLKGEHGLDHFLPEAREFGRLRVLVWLEGRGIHIAGVVPDPIRRLAAVVRTDAAGARDIADRLLLPAKATERLVSLAEVEPAAMPTWTMDDDAMAKAIAGLGAERVRDLALIAWAGRKSAAERTPPSETAAWTRLIATATAAIPAPADHAPPAPERTHPRGGRITLASLFAADDHPDE